MRVLARHVPLRRRMPLVASTKGLRRKPKADPVTPQVAAEVFERDLRIAGGCVPRYLGAPGDCRDRWGNVVFPHAREALTLNHVREHEGGMRRSVPRWLNAGCWFHNVQGWELAHVEELREYLAEHAT